MVLAQTVLKHIREGSTQLAAFEETASQLNRSAAACGFRWNSEVRKRYAQEIKTAKEQRTKSKMSKRNSQLVSISSVVEMADTEPDYLDQIITAARNAKIQFANMSKQIKTLSKELQQMKLELQQYKQGAYTPDLVVNEDFKAMLQILERARKSGTLGQHTAI